MSAVSLKTHQNAPQPQIGDEAMADAVQLVKTLETPYLRDLRRLIDSEIMSRASVERSQAIFQIQQIAASLGTSVHDLMSGMKERKVRSDAGKVVAPTEMKYQDPTDTARKWSGRGLAPKWVKDWEAQHGSREGLLIAKA